MKKLKKKIEDIMVAITFAEAGEYDEASKLSGGETQDTDERQVEGLKKTAFEKAGK